MKECILGITMSLGIIKQKLKTVLIKNSLVWIVIQDIISCMYGMPLEALGFTKAFILFRSIQIID